MNVYTVFGHAAGGMANFKDDIEAVNTREAINKAYGLHGDKYTMDKVYNQSGMLMADWYKIYNR